MCTGKAWIEVGGDETVVVGQFFLTFCAVKTCDPTGCFTSSLNWEMDLYRLLFYSAGSFASDPKMYKLKQLILTFRVNIPCSFYEVSV